MLEFFKRILGKKIENSQEITSSALIPPQSKIIKEGNKIVETPPESNLPVSALDSGFPVAAVPSIDKGKPLDTNKAKVETETKLSTKEIKHGALKANLPNQANVGTNEINTGAMNIGSTSGSAFISVQNGHFELRDHPDAQGIFVRIKAGTPTKYNDLTTKAYVDAITSGYNITATPIAATTGTNLNISSDLENGDSLDKLILFTGQLVLVKDQADQTENGIYMVNWEGPAARYPASELLANNIFYVSQGTVNHETFWKVVGSFTGSGGQPNYGIDNINFVPVTMHPGGGTGVITLNGTAPIIVTNPSAGTYGVGLGTSGVTPGTYNSVVVDANGIITFGTNNPAGSGTVTEIDTGPGLTGGPITTNGTISLTATGVTAGTYQGLVINQYGQVTNANNENYGTGSVTSIATGTGLTGGPITNNGTIAMVSTGVTAGTYGDTSHVAQITVNALGQITNATNISITGGSGGLFWNNVSGTTQAMSPNNGYITNNSALTDLTLPTTVAQGAVLAIAGANAGGWQLLQNSGQTVHFGNQNTTTGTSGMIASTHQFDYIELLCVIANTDFIVKASVGNLSIT